jgi:hypothetical protein
MDGWPLKLQRLGAYDGREVWIAKTEHGNYATWDNGAMTVFRDREDAERYGLELLGQLRTTGDA